MKHGRLVGPGAPRDVITGASLSDLYGTAVRVVSVRVAESPLFLTLICLLGHAGGPVLGADPATRAIMDMAGRTVQLPARIGRVVTLGSLPVINSFVFTMGEGRTIVNGLAAFGQSPHWKYQTVFAPHLARLPTMQQPNREPNLEAIVLAKPDVVLTMHRASVDLLKPTGIPTIFLAWREPEDVKACIALLGEVFRKADVATRYRLAKAVLYPTLGLLWEAELFDAELSAAYCRAYNRWIADFCRDSAGRLVPIAHLSLGDPAEAARGLRRAVEDGCRGAFVCPFTITRVPHGDPRHDAVFAAAQELGVPLAIHPTFEPAAWNVHHRYEKFGWAVWYFDLFAGPGVQHAFATFFQLGVFERFPRLQVVVLESQAGWIGAFLDRADAIFTGTTLGATVRPREKPSHYFRRQCFISADPDERTIAAMMALVGEDRFFWAGDYPHPDHPAGYLDELAAMVAPMTETGRRGILGENVARGYAL